MTKLLFLEFVRSLLSANPWGELLRPRFVVMPFCEVCLLADSTAFSLNCVFGVCRNVCYELSVNILRFCGYYTCICLTKKTYGNESRNSARASDVISFHIRNNS